MTETRQAPQMEALSRLCQTLIDVHAQVVMDTPGDRELHDRAIATFRAQLALLTEGDGCRCEPGVEPEGWHERRCRQCEEAEFDVWRKMFARYAAEPKKGMRK